jgi:hypothetical protein
LDQHLGAVLEGKETPADDAERLVLAQFCQLRFKKHYATSCRFFAEAFANDATLADDMHQQHRYNAACAAALAGCGQGNDADKLDDKERARLRKQAVLWLRADLADWTKEVESNALRDPDVGIGAAGAPNGLGRKIVPIDPETIQTTMKHWQDDADLAGIRDRDAVAKLPPDEREACQKLWADVAELLKKAGDAK